MAWNPYGVALELFATAGTVTRTSATAYTVVINVSWETYYSGASTTYGMRASSGGKTITLNSFNNNGNKSGSGTLTGSYTISGNASATKTITVTFTNFSDTGASKSTTVNLSVKVPAWTSYTITYNANGGSGAPSKQTKWKDQALTLSSTKPTKTGHTFQGWSTSSSATSATYSAGGTLPASVNANTTLYAVWKANTYTVTYNANGGALGDVKTQTKTYGKSLTLTGTATRPNYNLKGWGTSASATTVTYAVGGSYTANAAITLYAIWELAYTKPRITNFTVKRCDSSGSEQSDGTYALVNFSWACDKTLSSITVKWKLASATSYSSSDTVTISDTSGTVSQAVGGGALAVSSSYTIRVTVTDELGSTSSDRTLNSQAFTIHAKPGGNGIAFGKMAELGATDSFGGAGVTEFAFDAKFNQPVYGKALGMDKLPEIPENSDLNDYIDPGCYAVYRNTTAATCSNIPVDKAGRLEVWSATGEGVRANGYSYIRQKYVPYDGKYAVCERAITRDGNNVWTYGNWWKSSISQPHYLWGENESTGRWMDGNQVITLSEGINLQPYGIVLVFCYYGSETDTNYYWQTFFVPKQLLATISSMNYENSHQFFLHNRQMTVFGMKYLTFTSGSQIKGHVDNVAVNTNNVIPYQNNKFVLRYVIGV